MKQNMLVEHGTSTLPTLATPQDGRCENMTDLCVFDESTKPIRPV